MITLPKTKKYLLPHQTDEKWQFNQVFLKVVQLLGASSEI